MITKCCRNDLVYFSPCYKIVNDIEATDKLHSGKFSIMSTRSWEVGVEVGSGVWGRVAAGFTGSCFGGDHGRLSFPITLSLWGWVSVMLDTLSQKGPHQQEALLYCPILWVFWEPPIKPLFRRRGLLALWNFY